MANSVSFRDFEERDIDFVFKCKNDDRLNEKTSGHYSAFSYEEAVQWVRGCMGEHDTFKFWAVCTNDDEQRIIGWISVSEIDSINKSACFHGIVIADPKYRDGMAWIESFLFVMKYIFEERCFHRMYGTALSENEASVLMGKVMFERNEGIFKDAVFKNGRYYDLVYCAILDNEYFDHKARGEYDTLSIIRRLGNLRRSKRSNT